MAKQHVPVIADPKGHHDDPDLRLFGIIALIVILG
jgi:hypothetical protein